MSGNSGSKSSIDQLYDIKMRKLKEQKILSDQMNDILSKNGGLNDSSKMALKNLQAAIAVAKQPGYFEYYVPPEDVKRIEEKKQLNSLARSVQKTHKELEQINEEIKQAESHNQLKPSEPPSISTIAQWYDVYGRPNLTEEKKDRMTAFVTNSKIYGGTKHYKSFKTSSTVMKKGRLTR